MKKGTIKSVAAMLCVVAVGVAPVFANVVAKTTTTTTTTTTTSVSTSYALGDVNKDGKVDLTDTTMILKAALAIEDLDDEATVLADIDASGKVDLQDATSSLKMALNIPL